IYLPDPKYQEVASGVETLVSTRLEPGVDPVLEADKRGTILLVVRLGGIDLEMPSTGAVTTIGVDTSAPLGPGVAPFNPPPGSVIPSTPLDAGAPVSPAPSDAGTGAAPSSANTVPAPVPDPTIPGSDTEPPASAPGLTAPGVR